MVIEVPTGAVSPNNVSFRSRIVDLHLLSENVMRTLRVKESLFFRNKGGTADYDDSSLVATTVTTRDFLRAYAEPWT